MSLSLRGRTAVGFSALFLTIQGLTLWGVYQLSKPTVIQQSGRQLAYAEQAFMHMLMEHGERIASESRILAADYGFRTTVSEADEETISSALDNLTARIAGDRGFYIDLKGRVLADTGSTLRGQSFPFARVLRAAQSDGSAVAFELIDGRLAELSVVPVLAPVPIGWVAIATSADQRLADHVARFSPLALDISLADCSPGHPRILASSLPAATWSAVAQDLPGAADGATRPTRAEIVTVVRPLPNSDLEQRYCAVLRIDTTESLAPYRNLASLAFLLSGVGGAAVLLGSVLLANRLTAPVRALAEASDALRQGEPNPQLLVSGDDELAKLAETFNLASSMAAEMHRLQAQDQKRREFVADVSHDLRTPLSVLHGYLETLRMKAGSLPPEESRRFLEVAVRQSEKLGRLAQELFELARLECDETAPRREDFCIAELSQDVVQKFLPQARNLNVALTAEWEPGLPPVNADIGMIERVLTNLLANALRHTPPGGSVRLTLARAGQAVEVGVTDTGCGIAAEYLPKLFDRDSPLSRRGSGAGGLGLVLVGKMLALHGVDIGVDSILGQGTALRFGLPLAGARPATAVETPDGMPSTPPGRED